ncbi:hypothetical protein LshimejAT787_5400020 [Lyophyllum shimeji]|uniref:Uncharacterized protein n=1 Tax=Lyophyllum shimeji TaxID=47721 RepID=A0A9P3PZN2_LYOSH|nr:hypothetical protein LshimejAT787_5400020 [Lyophyllum shimeji]
MFEDESTLPIQYQSALSLFPSIYNPLLCPFCGSFSLSNIFCDSQPCDRTSEDGPHLALFSGLCVSSPGGMKLLEVLPFDIWAFRTGTSPLVSQRNSSPSSDAAQSRFQFG